jgi:fermentation-respiration switch protein FrsA (DUF1100 family)
MLFFPLKDHLIDPGERGVNYQNIYVETSYQQKLHGWLLPEAGDLKGTVVFFHGNGENISTHVGAVYWLPQYGYRVILVDYRGYGKSDGQATLDGAIDDIKNTLQYVVDHFPGAGPLIVMGQSIGASMSIYAVASSAVKQKIDGLVLVAPFSDYHKVAQETLSKSWLTWLFQYPLSWTINNDYRPLEYIKSVNPVPVYFIHGKSDNIISMEHSQKLFKLALEPKKLFLIEGGHNDIAATRKYREVLISVLNEIKDR